MHSMSETQTVPCRHRPAPMAEVPDKVLDGVLQRLHHTLAPTSSANRSRDGVWGLGLTQAAPRTGGQVKRRQVQAAQRDRGAAQFAHRARHGLSAQRPPLGLC